MFGDNFTKRTLLWLRGLPHLKASVETKPENTERWVNAGYRKQGTRIKDTAKACSAKDRARTFEGIANAMAEQWADFVMMQLDSVAAPYRYYTMTADEFFGRPMTPKELFGDEDEGVDELPRFETGSGHEATP